MVATAAHQLGNAGGRAIGRAILFLTSTHIRGTLPKWDGQSVFVTGMTPFHHTLSIG